MSTLYRLWWNAIPDIVSGSGSRTRSKKTSIHRIPRKCPHGTVSRSGSQARSEVVASLGLLFINFRCYTSKGKQVWKTRTTFKPSLHNIVPRRWISHDVVVIPRI
ncbi:uncharacterized protein LOC129738688 isoform X1 [Uranotaenia lowii]|uniref:uncharacterized protein LOC129738688 isoform X1 n=1 Tax=Uranotaenia lowii TaxID=190385 RepID=UPI0024783391|nr:uncharacterized protein LOC129738688 isoform X1 [Uranotaenia lowii]